jgi:hypothetical protein
MSGQWYDLAGQQWRSPSRPPLGPPIRNTRKARLASLSISGTASTVSAADPTPPRSRVLPNHPSVNYTDLYRSGDSLAQTIQRMTGPAVMEFPSGEFDFSDFSVYGGFTGSYFGFWNTNNYLLGLGGQGKNQTLFRINPNSSTHAGDVPAQSTGSTNQLYFGRLGGPGTNPQTLVHDVCLQGTDQPVSSADSSLPHMYNGLMNFTPSGSMFVGVKIMGMPGDYNSPPGETAMLNDYKGVNSVYLDCETDGFNPQGQRRGSSSIQFNNSINSYIEDSYFHDAYVSGVTWSFTGSVSNVAASSSGIETHRVKVEHNANHILQPGFRFAAFNHENVQGKIRHYAPDLSRDNMEWNVGLMIFSNYNADNADIEIHNPIWYPSQIPAQYNGAYVLQMPPTWFGQPNKQVTAPKVFNADGSQKTPYVVTSYTGTSVLPINPQTQYVLIKA